MLMIIRDLKFIIDGMHIYFSGIGGTGIGPLALVAHAAGYDVSGSDKQDSQYIAYLKKHGITNIHIGQDAASIADVHAKQPIDWFVYTSALTMENADAPELTFCKQQAIKVSKRDALLNQILQDKQLKLLAIAGTHGKSTTTAMLIWLLKSLDMPIGYNVGAKISFGDMGEFAPNSQYFVYECDEFDRNFLNFEPYISAISGVSWDHHEIFPTRDEYQQAFRDFINQSATTVLWQDDYDYLSLNDGVDSQLLVQNPDDQALQSLTLKGVYNRRDAWLKLNFTQKICDQPIKVLIDNMNRFTGSNRRMEQLAPNVYSDYAHTPEKIRGAMSVALEMANDAQQSVVVLYEPLTNRRQHYMLDDYKDCFAGAKKVYWLPSYLAREDPHQAILSPAELISHLADPSIAVPAQMDAQLLKAIEAHVADGDLVIAMAGGGGDSLDEWLRQHYNDN